MTQMDVAKRLGISQGWLWKIYHGYAIPGKSASERLEKLTGKPQSWWATAKVSQVQKTIDNIEV